MAKAQTQTQTAPTAAQNVAANAAAQIPTTLGQAEMVALAHSAHGLGNVANAYHGGNCPCLSKTKVPMVAANALRAFVAKYPTAVVKPTGVASAWGTKGKATGKRATIKAAIVAGGSVASIVAVSKANGASFAGLADLGAAVWDGVAVLHHK